MYVVCLTLYVLFLKMFGSQYFCSSSFLESSTPPKWKFVQVAKFPPSSTSCPCFRSWWVKPLMKVCPFSSPCSHLFPTNINLVAKIMLAIVGVWLVSNGPAAICIVVFLQTFARDSLCNITFIPVSTWQLYNAPFDSLKKKPSSSRIFFHFFILEAEVYHKIWL